MDFLKLSYYARECINAHSDYVLYNWAAYGGWERWFQGTFAPFLFYKFQINSETEGKPKLRPDQPVSQNRQRVDLILNKDKITTFVELKCIPNTASIENGNIATYCNGVYEDWKKLYYRLADYLVSLVLIPNDVYGIGSRLMNELTNRAKECDFRYIVTSCMPYNNPFMYVCSFEISYNKQNNYKILLL